MGTWELSDLPKDLLLAQRRFQAWRQRRQQGDRIPQSLWDLAVRLVGAHGVSRTSTALGVDYYTLQRRAEEAADQRQPNEPAFVELPSPIAVGKQALFELNNGTGTTRRVQLTGYDAAEVAILARCFWNAD